MTGSNPQTAALPVIGTRVTYHGSLTQYHGRGFLLFPHDVSLSAGETLYCDCDHHSRYTLVDIESDIPLFHVREASFTVEASGWWPEDAIDIVHGGFVYKASHALPGGSPTTRILAFHTAGGEVLNQWGTLREITDTGTIRILDERGLDPFRARLTPSPASS
ncbi:hypothetical protein ACYCCF_30190 [Streptomyces argenteolus]|uniref:hypothetical protein n=1 Tax=Streptomyces sp. NPDC025273 TaxID=3155251 RepID=UPI0034116AF8